MAHSSSGRLLLLALAIMLHGEPQTSTEADRAGSAPVAVTADGRQLQRVSTAVPWPRGLVFMGDELIVLARGRHRSAGGPDPAVEDMAGTLFRVDPDLVEPVVAGVVPSDAVRANGEVFVQPTAPPFKLWDRSLVPARRDTSMDRPYCTLAYDAATSNFFICGFSGADLPDNTFRKNATDSVLRYDLRSALWSVVDVHRGELVSDDELGPWVPNDTYPHHDPAANPAPHGWLNGPDGAVVVGRWLYVVAKDNNRLVRYDLGGVAEDPLSGPPIARPEFEDRIEVRAPDGSLQSLDVHGHSALDAFGGYLYVGFRTTSQIVRFALDREGALQRPLVGELVARFDPYDPVTGRSHDLMDIAFNSRGELFVSTARIGSVWNIGVPDPRRPFDGRTGTTQQPYVNLRELTGNPRAKTGNITFDGQDRLYMCSGNYDAGNEIAGVIYRVVPTRG